MYMPRPSPRGLVSINKTTKIIPAKHVISRVLISNQQICLIFILTCLQIPSDNLFPFFIDFFKTPLRLRYDYSDPRPSKQFSLLRSFLQESLAGPITVAPVLKGMPHFGDIYRRIR